ncbi:MAG: GNAT family N-acetyltransferase, partial [Phycisphaeraceae bacterium]
RSAIAFLSPASGHDAAVHAMLIKRAVAAVDRSKTGIVQALLESQHQLQAEAFTEAGFQRLAHLVYMQRTIHAQHVMPLLLEPGLSLTPWANARRRLFRAAITASYEETLDCPGLLGLREVDEVIDGHMATGEFTPSLWLALHRGEEPVGVMLLNLVMQKQNLELVYLGLAKPWRGKGLGRKLMHRALELAQQHQVKHLVLAVDELNTAALKLYRSMGFSATVRKLAMVRSLREGTEGEGTKGRRNEGTK